MTLTEERPVLEQEVFPEPPAAVRVPRDEEPLVNPLVTSLSALLSAAAAGWLAGGVFSGLAARWVGVLGAFLGAATVALSYRSRRTSLIQYVGVAVSVLAGVLLVLPDAGKGSANLPSLVVEAIRTGGIGAPPIPFLPGWRFVMVVFIALLSGGSAAAAIGLNKPKVAVFVPLPVVFGAALLQPASAPAAYTAIAVSLIPAALTVSHGAQLVQEGSTSSRFEVRRLLRSALVVLLTMVLLVVLSALGLFLPKPSDDTVVPPKRPEPPAAQPDHRLFTVSAVRQVPWRLGVLDGYDGKGWLLPPFDPKRLLTVPDSGQVPASVLVEGAKPRPTMQVTFHIDDLPGAVAPDLASPVRVDHRGFSVKVDPRTQTLRLTKGRVPSGTEYTITAAIPPTAAQLITAPAAPASMNEFMRVPTPPTAIVELLSKAPTSDEFDRLQFVRDALYRKVVASGGGKPVDVPPNRVVAMLGGADASPFEITAAEVLLARWAGVPARMGYGYYGGSKIGKPAEHLYEIRPKHGATWLEAWFKGYGWVPLVGVPNKAKASLNDKQQDRPDVHPSEQVALAAFVPVRSASVQLLFELLRYWALRIGGLLALLIALWWSSAGLLKMLRRSLRGQWARRAGPRSEVLAAYAELRDKANDLNIGNPYDSPLEFLQLIEPDAEHAELAWLVTRAVWGDLKRGVLPQDAELAWEMARSVEKRLAHAQPGVSRFVAFGSRASLRTPYSAELPNLWPRWRLPRPRLSLRGLLRALRPSAVRAAFAVARHALRPRRSLAIGAGVTAVLLAAGALVVAGTSGASATVSHVQPTVPNRTVPAKLGDLVFKREPALEKSFRRAGANALVNPGVVYSIRKGDEVLGSLQITPFKGRYLRTDADLDDVRAGVVAGLGNGNFTPQRTGTDVLLAQQGIRTDLYLWFAPDTSYFEVLVAGHAMQQPDVVLASVLAYQRGQRLSDITAGLVPRIDPRQGGVN